MDFNFDIVPGLLIKIRNMLIVCVTVVIMLVAVMGKEGGEMIMISTRRVLLMQRRVMSMNKLI